MTAGQVAGWREILAGHARIIGVPEAIVGIYVAPLSNPFGVG